jgi:hypothetical protein
MTTVELLNNIFIETDTIKMNHLIVNYLSGNSYDLRAIDDAVNLLDSPLTNSINSKELTFETTASAICRILYTAGLWRSLCDFYLIIRSFDIFKISYEIEIERDINETDERMLVARYAFDGKIIRMTVDDNSCSIRIKVTQYNEARF